MMGVVAMVRLVVVVVMHVLVIKGRLVVVAIIVMERGLACDVQKINEYYVFIRSSSYIIVA